MLPRLLSGRKPALSAGTTTEWKVAMQTLNADVQSRTVALVKAILEQNSIVVEFDPDSRLADIGLTSMDMVNLMLGVEAEFDFTIPQSEITPENFKSVATLQRMIARRLQADKAA
jgi:acyl carrier protein